MFFETRLKNSGHLFKIVLVSGVRRGFKPALGDAGHLAPQRQLALLYRVWGLCGT